MKLTIVNRFWYPEVKHIMVIFPVLKSFYCFDGGVNGNNNRKCDHNINGSEGGVKIKLEKVGEVRHIFP